MNRLSLLEPHGVTALSYMTGAVAASAGTKTGAAWPDAGLIVFTNKELFNRRRLHKLDSLETRPVSFQELIKLKNGDFVVHVDYGIGIYRGLKNIDAYGKERECLILEYRDGDG